jgi:hypothetical protein
VIFELSALRGVSYALTVVLEMADQARRRRDAASRGG